MSTRGNQKNIIVATSEEEARKILSQDADFLIVNDGVKNTAISMAMDKAQGGIDEARRFIGNTLAQERAAANAQARRNTVAPILAANTHTFNGLADAIFRAASDGYISLSPYVTVGGGPYRMAVITQALEDWEPYLGDAALDANIRNVHVFPPEDKARKGKGNVGDTIATRKWQADVISTWFGRIINVHIDLDKRDMPQ